MADALIQRRVEGKSWKEIADEFGYKSPQAVRTAFTKLTGLTDYKIKGPAIKTMFEQKKAGLLPDVPKIPKAAKKTAQAADKLVSETTKAPVEIPTSATPESKIEQITHKSHAPKSQFGDPDTYDKIVNMANASYKYGDIKSKFPTLSFDEIDGIVWNDLLQKHDGDIWKAFKSKPTSERGFNAVKKMIGDLRAMGCSAKEVSILSKVDQATVDAILKNRWKPMPPGTMFYTPPSLPAVAKPSPGPLEVKGGPSFSVPTPPPGLGEYRYPTKKEMDDWIMSLGNDLNYGELDALRMYTGSGYRKINGVLRGQIRGSYSISQSVEDEVRSLSKKIDNTFRPAPQDMRLGRKTGANALGGRSPSSLVGQVIQDPGYLSTSIMESMWSGDIQFIIDVPKGAPIRWVDNISMNKGELEVLLPRNAKLKVKRVHGNTIYVNYLGV